MPTTIQQTAIAIE